MKQALEGATEEDRAAVAEMLVRPQRPAREARGGGGHRRGLRRVHGQARRLLPGEPAGHGRAARLARPARRRGPADAELDDRGAAPGADGALAAGLRLAAADGAAGPDGRQPPGAATRRGLVGVGELRGRAGHGPRRRHRRAPGPRPARRARRPALPVLPAARGSTTSTSTRSPASSAPRRRSPRRPSRSSSARCATAATSSAGPTASCGSRPRRCASSARRCCATWPTG